MRKTVEVYALAVCFFTMACLALATGSMLWNVVKLLAPAATISAHEYKVHKNDDAYAHHLEERNRYRIDKGQYQVPVGAELTTERERSYAALVDAERHGALRSVLSMLVIILVDIAVYCFHWRIVNREKKATNALEPTAAQ